MTKVSASSDPLFNSQWHLKALFGENLADVMGQYSGKGISVGIYDDGLDKNHADLKGNYNAAKELTYGGVKADPSTGTSVHGTAVAGIIGAVGGNGTGGTGIANEASLTGVNIFSGLAYNNYIASIRAKSTFDITNDSWGWTSKYADNSAVAGSFGKQFVDALQYAADTGRGGKGTIMVNSAGNDNLTDNRDANQSEFNASRVTITVGAIGQDGDVASYATRGASILVSGPTNGGGAGVTTTDKTGSGGYSSGDSTSTFGGTSAAAPMVSGVMALMLEASFNSIGWRDAQDILAYTAVHTTPAAMSGGVSGRMEYGWTINKADNANGGGLHYSNDVGYGMVNGFEAVRWAEVWSKFGAAETSANEAKTSVSGTVNKAISDNSTTTFTANVSQQLEIEHVDLTLTLTHQNVNDLKIILTSPEGTRSIVLDASSGTNAFNNTTWTYGTEALRGELSQGTWKVEILDTKTGSVGSVASYKLDVYGDTPSPNDVYHYTQEFREMLALDASRGVLKDVDGGIDWINAAGMTADMTINLNAGAQSKIGSDNFVAIALGTVIENVVSGDGDDTLIGNSAANELMGMRGDDTLEGRGGADVLDGGAGVDTATYASSPGAVDVDLKRAAQIGGDAQGDVLKSIENVTGTVFADVLRGDEGANVLKGGAGNDVLEGRGGGDVLDGGAGHDIASWTSWGKAIDIKIGRAVNPGTDGDVLISIEGIEGTAFNDRLEGDDFANTLLGGKGDDVLVGGMGADTLDGGEGIDTVEYLLSKTGVQVNLKTGINRGSHAEGDVIRNVENVTGSLFGDTITGDEKSNVIRGEAGSDTLYGMGGDDVLVGDAGNDLMYGGAGRDVFVYDKRGYGTDIIGDFTQGEDKISFAGMGITFADLVFGKSSSITTIDFANDGGQILLLGSHNLKATDFVFA